MKLKRTTKEIKKDEFVAIIRKLSAYDVAEIQKKSIKFKDNAAGVEINKKNFMQFTETDSTNLRFGMVLASLVKWNIETEDSTPENIKYVPITEEFLKSPDFDNDLFLFIEQEVNQLNNPSVEEIKN